MTSKTIQYPASSLEDLCEALAEGATGDDTEGEAGYAVIQWPGADCPWFLPRPYAAGFDVADFVITEI